MVWLGHEKWEDDLISKIEEHNPISIWTKSDKNLIRLGIGVAIILLAILLLS
jgi:hypothetical protein